ncbi:unnamed protein product [Clonostachys chloroleuca]|uniref:Thiamine pyrophosphate enzyme TPP-binding domain-containing protein n=1 Tax=Clonostachys chloroleuca TaxID=1926264 RepID=A0AA35LZP5_9HYPO|nr:unnamed protein product [Clonostachys chloroleuca]
MFHTKRIEAEAETCCKANALTSVEQITANLKVFKALAAMDQSSVEAKRREAFKAKIADIEKHLSLKDTIWAHEAVTNTRFVHDNIRPTKPLSFINCGEGGLGWSGGAALGIKLASDAEAGGEGKGKFVAQIAGDETYLFSVPGSVSWISQRYKIPVLTIALNNKGIC